MTFTESCLPTHSMLARAAAAPVGRDRRIAPPSVNSPNSRNSRIEASPNPLRKYVIVLDAAGLEHPIIFPSACQHSKMVPPGMIPISAGFIYIEPGDKDHPEPHFSVNTHIGSESLKLDPRPQDAAILRTFFCL